MLEEYTLDKNSPIIIYGFGLQGRRICKNFEEHGYAKIIIVDKRAEEISNIEGKTIHGLNVLDDVHCKEYPVVIAIHDSIQQDEVISMLISKGYKKIISIPLRIGIREYQVEIRKIYNLILDNDLEKINNIPCYAEEELGSDCKIAGNNDCVTFWLDSLFLFTMHTKYAVETGYSKLPLKDQDDICMLGNITHDVFSYFINGKISQKEVGYDGMIQQHIALNTMSPMEFWNQRKKLYEFYSEELRNGMQYFIDNPLDVKLNQEKNRVNLLDGHHRAGFLLAANSSKIPVRISEKEYQILYKKAEIIKDWCEDNQYPNLINNDERISIRYMQMLGTLYEVLKGQLWREGKFLVVGDIFFAQHLVKEGAQVSLVTNDSKAEWINSVLDIKKVQCISEEAFVNHQKNYDYIVIHQRRINHPEYIINGLSGIVAKHILWYSGINPENEKENLPENIKMLNYKRCRYYFEDLVEQEWGVFSSTEKGI